MNYIFGGLVAFLIHAANGFSDFSLRQLGYSVLVFITIGVNNYIVERRVIERMARAGER